MKSAHAPDNDDIQVTVSVGVVATRADASLDPGELIAIADAAMYRAKNSGRNRVEVVDHFSRVGNRRKTG